ncbi:hypothetical protein GCM10009827_060210 [Dactylosporangium maewongense]|uniref:Uncharacterized protein n=1 Tax=Dactylosporangium maewongense TaxID=634393 RepID=A0ABP4M1K2_9ACTN
MDLQPSELALRDWVRTRLNASIIREIAALDYGMRVDGHRRAIEELLVARRLPDELEWEPGEVLSLCASTPIADRHPVPGSAGWRAHVARLFACTILTRTGEAAHLSSLVESALDLGPEATAQAARFLAWCRIHTPGRWRDEPVSRPFLTLGLLLMYDDPRLHDEFADEVRAAVPVELWWADDTPSAPLKEATGGPAWRVWRSLVDRHTEHALLRSWFRLDVSR